MSFHDNVISFFLEENLSKLFCLPILEDLLIFKFI